MRTRRKTEPRARKSPSVAQNCPVEIAEKICHISWLVKESSAKIISSGTALASRPSDERSWPSTRAKTQRRIASRP